MTGSQEGIVGIVVIKLSFWSDCDVLEEPVKGSVYVVEGQPGGVGQKLSLYFCLQVYTGGGKATWEL